MSKICVVIGIGPGIGEHTARKFAAEGYKVALLSRTIEKLQAMAADISGSQAFQCDVSKPDSVKAAFAAVRKEMGEPDVVIFNSGSGTWKTYDQVTPEQFQDAFDVNAKGLFTVAQEVGPVWTERGSGAIGITGATANWRGMPFTAGFAPAKAAQRSLAQALARDLGPKGIHVFNIVVDGMVDLPATRAKMPDKPDEVFIKPASVGNLHFQLATQDPSCWTFELNVSPARQFGGLVTI
mmetsp:Transcript_39551/g.86322  ORF Transcript_39551/g.86322 Transcript_39551/m.86322 type:complete len:238 (-) Transcript_39551:98-811(-)